MTVGPTKHIPKEYKIHSQVCRALFSLHLYLPSQLNSRSESHKLPFTSHSLPLKFTSMGTSTLRGLVLLTLTSLIVSISQASACELNSTKHHHNHNWTGPTGHRTIVVDANGSGDFLSVQEAVDSIPENNTQNVTIWIHAGSYM